MQAQSLDTDLKTESFHIKLLREAPVYRLLEMVNSLTKTVYWFSWHGICERYNNEPLNAQLERFVAFLYNDKILAKRVIKALENKGALAQ